MLQIEILCVIVIWFPIETIFFFCYRIFAGYNKLVRIFDLHRPGRDFGQHSTLQGNKEGQTGCYLRLNLPADIFWWLKDQGISIYHLLWSGIISAIAFSPTHSGMLALGSYSQTTGIYREDNMELLYVLHGQEGGITHVWGFCCYSFHMVLIYIFLLRWCYVLSRSNFQKMEIIYTLEVERYKVLCDVLSCIVTCILLYLFLKFLEGPIYTLLGYSQICRCCIQVSASKTVMAMPYK